MRVSVFSVSARAARPPAGRLWAMAVMFAVFGLLLHNGARAESEQVLERQVKAAFLYRFTEFITWPEEVSPTPNRPFVIAVIGPDSLADELRQVVFGRAVQNRPVEVRRLSGDSGFTDENIIFISDEQRQRLPHVVRAAPRGALIVTESNGALSLGSIINFVLVDGRVRFEIALDAAERRGLRLSSRLLAVAQTVRTGAP